MPRENWQKIKLLKLVELLRQETDEYHLVGGDCGRIPETGGKGDGIKLRKSAI